MFIQKYGRIDIDGVKRQLIDERVRSHTAPLQTPLTFSAPRSASKDSSV